MIDLFSWRRTGAGIGVALLANAGLNAQALQSLVAVTPCRAVDTRLATGALGGRSWRAAARERSVATKRMWLTIKRCGPLAEHYRRHYRGLRISKPLARWCRSNLPFQR